MKTLLIASLVSATIVLNAFAQNQPPPPPPAATQAPAVTNPAQPGAVPPTTMSPAAPGQAPGATQPLAPGMSPAGAPPGTMASPAAPGVMPSPAASMPATLSPAPSGSPSTAQSPQKAGWTNFILENFHKGGPIMWPILIVSIIGV